MRLSRCWGADDTGNAPAVWGTCASERTHAMAGTRSCPARVSIVLVWRNGNIVGLPVFEEPSGRSGREETKANKKNYCNQNSHSERNHVLPPWSLPFCVRLAIRSVHRNDQSKLSFQETHYACRFRI